MTTSWFPRSLSYALLVAACGTAMTSPSWAGRTYYVDTNNPAADDHGPGTQAVPFKTILHGAKQLQGSGTGGNTILVEPGVYYERVPLYSQGAAGDTNVVRADGPGVILDGSLPVPAGSWSQGPGTIWYFTGAVGALVMDGHNVPYTTAPVDSMPVPSWHEDLMIAGVPVYVNLGGDDPHAHDMR